MISGCNALCALHALTALLGAGTAGRADRARHVTCLLCLLDVVMAGRQVAAGQVMTGTYNKILPGEGDPRTGYPSEPGPNQECLQDAGEDAQGDCSGM